MSRSDLPITLLKNLPFPVDAAVADRQRTELPYRIDHLRDHRIRLHYTNLSERGPFRRLHDPTVQTVRLAGSLIRDPVTLAMFESSGHPLGLLRSLLPPLRRTRLAVISCWLSELLADATPSRVARYRRVYAHVDRLWAYSHNQLPLLREALGLPSDRVAALTFGIDHLEFTLAPPAPEGPVLAVGRDRGRDWPTLLTALGANAMPARLVCRRSDLDGLQIPSNVEVVGRVSRQEYRRMLGEARVVVITTRVLGYPTGQSVLLEAMARGRPCIVTDTPAMRDYVTSDGPACLVPPGDPDALAEALRGFERGDEDLEAIGRRSRETVVEHFTAAQMWATVAADLHELAERA